MYDLKIVKNYSKALFSNAVDSNVSQKVFDQIKLVRDIFQEIEIFREVMVSPIIQNFDKSKVFEDLGKKLGFEKMVIQFFNILIKNRRIGIFLHIVESYNSLLEEMQGIKSVDITAASKLADEEILEIKQFLAAQLEKIIKINMTQNHSLIGGVIIKYDSNLLDFSVQGAIDRMSKIARATKF